MHQGCLGGHCHAPKTRPSTPNGSKQPQTRCSPPHATTLLKHCFTHFRISKHQIVAKRRTARSHHAHERSGGAKMSTKAINAREYDPIPGNTQHAQGRKNRAAVCGGNAAVEPKMATVLKAPQLNVPAREGSRRWIGSQTLKGRPLSQCSGRRQAPERRKRTAHADRSRAPRRHWH